MILYDKFAKVIIGATVPIIMIVYLVFAFNSYTLFINGDKDISSRIKIVLSVLFSPILFTIGYLILGLCLDIVKYIYDNILSKVYKIISDLSVYLYTWPITFIFFLIVSSFVSNYLTELKD